MRTTLIAVIALATIPAVAQMPAQAPGARDASRITGGTYQADPGHTLVRWTVDHLGFTPYFGIFGDVTGTLTLDPRRPSAAKVDMTIPIARVTTASSGLTAHLLRPGKDGGKADFFGAAPADARFVSTAVTVVAANSRAKVTGLLTLNGVQQPVTLDVTFYGAGTSPAMGGMPARENVGFEAETTIRRSDFGIAQAIPLVSDAVKLHIAAGFAK